MDGIEQRFAVDRLEETVNGTNIGADKGDDLLNMPATYTLYLYHARLESTFLLSDRGSL